MISFPRKLTYPLMTLSLFLRSLFVLRLFRVKKNSRVASRVPRRFSKTNHRNKLIYVCFQPSKLKPGSHHHQHPIIFGKSKDSILVPDFNGTATSKTTTTTTTTQIRNHSVDSTSSSHQLMSNTDADLCYQTRVLTDEKGHSIKIRVASPPPQRHQVNRQQQEQQPAAASQHRDSVVSLGGCPESSLINGDRRDSYVKFSSSDEHNNNNNQLDTGRHWSSNHSSFRSPRLKRKPRNHHQQRQQQRQQHQQQHTSFTARQRPKSSMARLAGEYQINDGGDLWANREQQEEGDVGRSRYEQDEEQRSSTYVQQSNNKICRRTQHDCFFFLFILRTRKRRTLSLAQFPYSSHPLTTIQQKSDTNRTPIVHVLADPSRLSTIRTRANSTMTRAIRARTLRWMDLRWSEAMQSEEEEERITWPTGTRSSRSRARTATSP